MQAEMLDKYRVYGDLSQGITYDWPVYGDSSEFSGTSYLFDTVNAVEYFGAKGGTQAILDAPETPPLGTPPLGTPPLGTPPLEQVTEQEMVTIEEAGRPRAPAYAPVCGPVAYGSFAGYLSCVLSSGSVLAVTAYLLNKDVITAAIIVLLGSAFIYASEESKASALESKAFYCKCEDRWRKVVPLRAALEIETPTRTNTHVYHSMKR